MFEIAGVSEASAKAALYRAAMKIPAKTRMVGRRISV